MIMGFKGLTSLPSRELDLTTFPSDTLVPIVLNENEYDVLLNPSYEYDRDFRGRLRRIWIVGYSLIHKTVKRYYQEIIRDLFGNIIRITEWRKPP